ncbi:MAG: YifB family Mg chelatase-like AAA ATPase [Candidatus Omnitrophota bacterium]|jgi:magnesium chelatase family protein
MLAKISSYGISGMDAYPVMIEVDVGKGLPAAIIVGLPDNAVKESKERVRSAIKNSGFEFKPRRITINLSPGDIKKEGPSFDLAIAIGILAASGQIPAERLERYVILGELSLDGRLRPVTGMLPIALAVSPQKSQGLIIPYENALHAALARTVPVYPARTLSEAVQFLSQPDAAMAFSPRPTAPSTKTQTFAVDFADVRGQFHAKRGLEVAAAGGHNCLMIGPPGSGKTMLAKRVPTILPEMNDAEKLEVTNIYSVLGKIPAGEGLLAQRPFRSPHHTISDAAMVGGGPVPKPGEITMAHNGVLFLDELPEFNRKVLETLRQPLEERTVTISRTARTIRFPAGFMLLASMNPCPCGYFTDPKKECRCAPQQVQKYHAKISGPLLDRIDIHLDVPALLPQELLSWSPPAETSADMKKRICRARAVQQQRLRKINLLTNAQMDHNHLKEFCPLDHAGQMLLKSAITELNLSARAHDKIVKVARTVSDLSGSERILPEHIAEAIQYRCLDRT